MLMQIDLPNPAMLIPENEARERERERVADRWRNRTSRGQGEKRDLQEQYFHSFARPATDAELLSCTIQLSPIPAQSIEK